jgi:NTP pyrophosphatase (non-canonical NTP hydrolase)
MIRDFETLEEEIVTILAEESAELIQEIMKMKRRNSYPSKQFQEELGDVMCLIDLCFEYKLANRPNANMRSYQKKEKLKKWSKIFEKARDFKYE